MPTGFAKKNLRYKSCICGALPPMHQDDIENDLSLHIRKQRLALCANEDSGTNRLHRRWNRHQFTPLEDGKMGRGILLWLLGIPLPIVILLVLFTR